MKWWRTLYLPLFRPRLYIFPPQCIYSCWELCMFLLNSYTSSAVSVLSPTKHQHFPEHRPIFSRTNRAPTHSFSLCLSLTHTLSLSHSLAVHRSSERTSRSSARVLWWSCAARESGGANWISCSSKSVFVSLISPPFSLSRLLFYNSSNSSLLCHFSVSSLHL